MNIRSLNDRFLAFYNHYQTSRSHRASAARQFFNIHAKTEDILFKEKYRSFEREKALDLLLKLSLLWVIKFIVNMYPLPNSFFEKIKNDLEDLENKSVDDINNLYRSLKKDVANGPEKFENDNMNSALLSIRSLMKVTEKRLNVRTFVAASGMKLTRHNFYYAKEESSSISTELAVEMTVRLRS